MPFSPLYPNLKCLLWCARSWRARRKALPGSAKMQVAFTDDSKEPGLDWFLTSTWNHRIFISIHSRNIPRRQYVLRSHPRPWSAISTRYRSNKSMKKRQQKKKKNYELCSYQCGCREWAKLEEETKRGWWYATRLQSGWVFLGPMPLLFLVLDLTVCSLLAARAINCWSWGWGGGIFSKMQQPVHLSQMH